MLPQEWTPPFRMLRITAHWTGGGHKASAHDKNAYHLLVEGDGAVVRGTHSIAQNSGSLKSPYAAHTRNCNTDSIGLSMCGMAGAVEKPFDAGRAPLTAVQFDKTARVAAELCRRYDIEVTPRTVLFHAEVQATLGITQSGKWDVAVLPFDPAIKGAKAVGDAFRALVATYLGKTPATLPEADPVPGGGQGRVTASALNFRRGPGEQHEATGSLPRGTVVIVNNREGSWLNVTTPAGHTGWVARSHIDIFDGPPAEEPTKPDPVRAIIANIRGQLDELEAAL